MTFGYYLAVGAFFQALQELSRRAFFVAGRGCPPRDNPAMTKCVRTEATGQEGVREITATGWDGRILRMSREAYLKWRKGGAEKLPSAAVCVLYADDFAKLTASQRFLFVGQVGAASPAGEVPEKDKPFWTVALVFLSASGWMAAEHTRAIEHAFIAWAREASRYDVANSVAEPPAQLPELIVQAYLTPVRTVLELAGIDVFQFNPEALFTLSRGPRFARLDKARARVVSATARTVEIYADSRVAVNQLPETVEKVQALVDAGVATFDSAAGVVIFTQATTMGTSGMFDTLLGTFPKDWVNLRRRSIRDVFDEHKPAPQPVPMSTPAEPCEA